MKTIIAPTDFSSSSLNSVNYAADLAKASGAKLILLNVVRVPITVSEVPMPEPVFEEMIDLAKQDLDDLAAKLTNRTKGEIKVSTEIMVGTVQHQIAEISNREKPFAIVMDMRGGHNIERFLLGSNTLSATRHLHYPVLIIPEDVHFKNIKKIGLACDFQNTEILPLDLIKNWLSVFGAELDIVHVNRDEKKVKSLNRKTIHIQDCLSEFHPQFHFVTSENISEGLGNFTRQQGWDLLIVVPRKHGFFGLVDEKHSARIIMHEQIPVLSIHEN
jgi:nucleotide-binding universal stress UspA family protein